MSPDRLVADRMQRHYLVARAVFWGLMLATLAAVITTGVMLLNSLRDGQSRLQNYVVNVAECSRHAGTDDQLRECIERKATEQGLIK